VGTVNSEAALITTDERWFPELSILLHLSLPCLRLFRSRNSNYQKSLSLCYRLLPAQVINLASSSTITDSTTQALFPTHICSLTARVFTHSRT